MMNNYIKNRFIKSGSIFFLAVGIVLLAGNSSHAQHMKKLTVEPLINPSSWKGLFKAGSAFSLMLEDQLKESGQFQIVRPEKKVKKIHKSNLLTNPDQVTPEEVATDEDVLTVHAPASQYRVLGRILEFEPDTNPLPEDHTDEEAFLHKEKAKIRVVIDLVNSHTGRSLVKKSFISMSTDGRVAFDPNFATFDFDSREFKSSSMGHALRKLSNLVEEFINDILSLVPLEGDLIWVDNKNDDVMLNLGEANGINVQDVFVVMALNQDFMDPLNQSDLGDKFTRKGIIKIVEVQGRFSRAKILAGSDFVPGDLVIPKFWKAIASRKKERSSKTKIIWGAFKGLPSLSY